MGRGRFINDTLSAAFGLQHTSLGDGNIARNSWLDSHLPGGRLASVSGLSCKWICLKNERNERQREEWEIELIAAGHGDNDFFMDPVRVKWPRRLVGLVFFFWKGMNVRVNITANRGIYSTCKRVWFYDEVYMPTTLPNDPLCIHAMQICRHVVRSCWWSAAPICWTRERIICLWYQNIVTHRG